MLAFLGLIPGAMQLITYVTGAIYDAKVRITMAQLQCDRDKAVAVINERVSAGHDRVTALQAIAGSPLLTCLVIAFASPLVGRRPINTSHRRQSTVRRSDACRTPTQRRVRTERHRSVCGS